MLTSEDIGHRVVVRHLIGTRYNRPLFTDILGELLTFDEIEITVATRTGVVRVARTAVAAGKRVPPKRSSGEPPGGAWPPGSARNA